jgi:hypothetical protein
LKLFQLLDPKLDPDVHGTASQTLIDIITTTYQIPGYENATPQEQQKIAAGGNNLLVMEMKSTKVLKLLFGFMLDRTQPNTSSSLINGITLVMEIIRRYCSEIEFVESQYHDFTMMQQNAPSGAPYPGMDRVMGLSLDLNDLFNVFSLNLPLFAGALDNPITPLQPVETTLGKQIPVGTERLKICELFAEFIHLQYLFTSSPLFDMMVTPVQKGGGSIVPTVADGLILISERFIQENIMERCINMFFVFPWNNFIHSVVYDMIAKIFNTYSFTASLANSVNVAPKTSAQDVSGNFGKKEEIDSNAFAQNKMRAVRRTVKKLVVSVFRNANLIFQIITAQRLNDYSEEQPKGVRLGYMGHLTYISDEVCKIFDKCAPELDDELHDLITSGEWHEYVSHSLRHTQETDRQPLGGARPDQAGNLIRPTIPGGMDGEYVKPKLTTDTKKDTTDIDEEPYDASTNPDTSYNDQFARFLCQQMVKDLPDRFLGDDSSDEDEDRWIGYF